MLRSLYVETMTNIPDLCNNKILKCLLRDGYEFCSYNNNLSNVIYGAL